jgi:hypothetical protein
MMRSIGFPSQPLKVFDEAAKAGVRTADSGRATVRDLYVQTRRQREVLAAALQLELE